MLKVRKSREKSLISVVKTQCADPKDIALFITPKRSLTLSYNYGTRDTAKSSESGHHFIATDLTLGFLRTTIYPRFMITAPDLKQILGRNIYILHNCDPRVRVRVRVHVLNICAGARVWLENLSFLHSLPEGKRTTTRSV